jgi:uncharacterized protein (DUF433 family)
MQNNQDRIVIEPDICNGRPIVRGTRISVQTILEFLGSGDSIEEILDAYPSLTRDDILAALRYSSRLMGNRYHIARVA